MNFYAFEYEEKIDFGSVDFDDTEYAQSIKKDHYYFLHQKTYGQNFADDWSDEEKKKLRPVLLMALNN